MKTLLATGFLLCASSLVTAQAEWEILDPGMPGSTAPATSTTSTAPATSTTSTAPATSTTSTAPATITTATAPATSTIETAKHEPATK